MSITRSERSAVFSQYNRLKPFAERGRLNRALGLVQSEDERPYHTTLERCDCPDWEYRISRQGGMCKHQAALALQKAAEVAKPKRQVRAGIDLLR